jgi:hypothetical protein
MTGGREIEAADAGSGLGGVEPEGARPPGMRKTCPQDLQRHFFPALPSPTVKFCPHFSQSNEIIDHTAPRESCPDPPHGSLMTRRGRPDHLKISRACDAPACFADFAPKRQTLGTRLDAAL